MTRELRLDPQTPRDVSLVRPCCNEESMNQFKDFEDVRNVFLSCLAFFRACRHHDQISSNEVSNPQNNEHISGFCREENREALTRYKKWPVKCNVRAHIFGAAFMAPVPALRGGETFGVR